MAVTLITTVFNEAPNIAGWLQSLKLQTHQPDEIVIVDGGSTDGTATVIQSFLEKEGYCFQLIVDKACSAQFSPGPIAKGRNIAISKANHENIVATDAGCIMMPDFVSVMKKALDAGADFIGGCYDLLSPNAYQEKLRSSFIPDFNRVRFPGGFLPSSRSIAFRKELWAAVDGYPEHTLTSEDTLFALKAVRYASNPILAKGAVVLWDSPRDRAELKFKCERYGYGDGRNKVDSFKYFLRAGLLCCPPLWVAFTIYKKRSFESFHIHLSQVKGYLRGRFFK